MKRPSVRNRMVQQAMRLFAERGYVGTSVSEIQAAVGLSSRSGALYRHFARKEEVLLAGLELYLKGTQQARRRLSELKMPPEQALAWIAGETLEVMASRRDDVVITWRELAQFPELRSKVGRVMRKSYRSVTEWLRACAQQGEIPEHDSEAVAAVLLGSLTMFRLFEAIWGERAVPVDDDRFLHAWCDIVGRGIGVRPVVDTLEEKPGSTCPVSQSVCGYRASLETA